MLTGLTVFKFLVAKTRVQTDTSESGDECLEMTAGKKYDLIFLDHMMPGKNGIETLHELRSQPDNPNLNTPVVCLTADAVSGAREEFISAGFSDYLTKPIDTSLLEDILIELLPAEKVTLV